MTVVLHIAPKFPPAICGVGDYATIVGGKMEALDENIECRYLALGHGASEKRVGDRDPAWFWGAVGEAIGYGPATPPAALAIVLHYSGYGYSPDGGPEWLASALEQRPPEWRDARVVTFFHELYATGRPWQRAFWHSGKQRRVAERVAQSSDTLITNREQSARWLETATSRPAGSVPHLPVPSNVGEPEVIPPYEERPPHAVVFGTARHKARFLTGRGARRTAQTCHELGIIRITDIGAETRVDRRPFESAGIDVVQTGHLAQVEVSRLLLKARIGFAFVSGWIHEKSGVLAAYASHGVVAITTASDPLPTPLSHGGALSIRSDRHLRWYASHGLTRHALNLLSVAAEASHFTKPEPIADQNPSAP